MNLTGPNTPFRDGRQPRRAAERHRDHNGKEREKQFGDMDGAFYTVEEDGREYCQIGKTRIRITEHFPEKGRTMGELIEELVLYAARREESVKENPK